MPRKIRVDFPGAAHHVYGRGNGKQAVFRDDEDRRTFLRRLVHYQSETGTRVLAYCLMVNHYHLVTITGHIPLSDFMQLLLTSYTRLFNDRWNTVGHLFQGRYGARPCTSDNDVRAAIRYVHLNPVEAKIVKHPSDWPWSGHRGIIAGKDAIVDVPFVRGLFGGVSDYEAFIAAPSIKMERRSLDEIGAGVAGPNARELLRHGPRTKPLMALRREFINDCLKEGYRRSDAAKYLGRSLSAISKLLDENLNNGA